LRENSILGVIMKKYEKPTLIKRERLSEVTAAPINSKTPV